MSKPKNPAERWLWYTSKTRRGVQLDPSAYPTTPFGKDTVLFPPWVCQKPDGGVHIDNRIGRIDVEVAKAPSSRIEFNWTWDYGVNIVSTAWLGEIRDLVDEKKISIGEVLRRGRSLENWATLHEAFAPSMFGSDGWATRCPICGDVLAMTAGRLFFADPNVVGRPLIVNRQGVFVREDLAVGRNLRTPPGAFKPAVVRFMAKPPAIRSAPEWVTGPATPALDDLQPPQSGWRRLASAVWKVIKS